MNSPHEILPDGHVVDLVQDYLHGRLDADRSALVRAHLSACDECAADYEFAIRLRSERAGAEDLAEFLEGLAVPSLDSARRRPRTAGPRPLRWAVSLVAVAAALLLLIRPFGSDSDLSGFAELEPLPVRIARDVPEAGSFEEARQLALSAYGDADYELAVQRCREAVRLRPEQGEMMVYEASALALLGRLDEAALRLDTLLRGPAQSSGVTREARWQRAQVALLQEDEAAARTQLELLFAEDGLRQEDAERVLRRLAGEN